MSSSRIRRQYTTATYRSLDSLTNSTVLQSPSTSAKSRPKKYLPFLSLCPDSKLALLPLEEILAGFQTALGNYKAVTAWDYYIALTENPNHPSGESLISHSDYIKFLYYIKRLLKPKSQEGLHRPVPPKVVQHRILWILNKIRVANISLPPSIYTSMIDAFAKTGDTDKAEFLFKEFIGKGYTPDIYLFNSMIYGYVRKHHVDKIFEWFDLMVLEYGIKPNTFTYNQIMNFHDANGDVPGLMKVWKILTDGANVVNTAQAAPTTAASAMASTATQSSSLNIDSAMLSSLTPSTFDLSSSTASSKISSPSPSKTEPTIHCTTPVASSSCTSQTIQQQVSAQVSDIVIDLTLPSNQSAMLSASSRASSVAEARKKAGARSDNHVVPDRNSYIILVSAMGRNGQPLESLKFFREALGSGLWAHCKSSNSSLTLQSTPTADSTSWSNSLFRRGPTVSLLNALLYSLTRNNHPDAAELLFESFGPAFKTQPNTMSYNLMIQMYVRRGDFKRSWGLVDNLRQLETKSFQETLVGQEPLFLQDSDAAVEGERDNIQDLTAATGMYESIAVSSTSMDRCGNEQEAQVPAKLAPISNSSGHFNSLRSSSSPSSSNFRTTCPLEFNVPPISIGNAKSKIIGINYITLASLYNAALTNKIENRKGNNYVAAVRKVRNLYRLRFKRIWKL